MGPLRRRDPRPGRPGRGGSVPGGLQHRGVPPGRPRGVRRCPGRRNRRGRGDPGDRHRRRDPPRGPHRVDDPRGPGRGRGVCPPRGLPLSGDPHRRHQPHGRGRHGGPGGRLHLVRDRRRLRSRRRLQPRGHPLRGRGGLHRRGSAGPDPPPHPHGRRVGLRRAPGKGAEPPELRDAHPRAGRIRGGPPLHLRGPEPQPRAPGDPLGAEGTGHVAGLGDRGGRDRGLRPDPGLDRGLPRRGVHRVRRAGSRRRGRVRGAPGGVPGRAPRCRPARDRGGVDRGQGRGGGRPAVGPRGAGPNRRGDHRPRGRDDPGAHHGPARARRGPPRGAGRGGPDPRRGRDDLPPRGDLDRHGIPGSPVELLQDRRHRRGWGGRGRRLRDRAPRGRGGLDLRGPPRALGVQHRQQHAPGRAGEGPGLRGGALLRGDGTRRLRGLPPHRRVHGRGGPPDRVPGQRGLSPHGALQLPGL